MHHKIFEAKITTAFVDQLFMISQLFLNESKEHKWNILKQLPQNYVIKEGNKMDQFINQLC